VILRVSLNSWNNHYYYYYYNYYYFYFHLFVFQSIFQISL